MSVARRAPRRKTQSIALSGTLALLSGAAWALQPLITDDTGTQRAGGYQIEAAYSRTSEKSPGSKTITQEIPLTFTRGFTDTLDLYAAFGRQRISTDPDAVENGWHNAAVGAKWRFHEDDASKLSFGLRPEIQLPVSQNREARGLGTARTGYALTVLMTQPTPFGVVHANLGAQRVRYAQPDLDAPERRMRYRLSAAPLWSVTETFKLALDAGVITNPDRGAKARMGFIEAAAIYSPVKDLDLTLGVIRNVLDGDADTLQATAGVTVRFR